MSFVECLKYYAELGYFIAGIILAFAAIFGLIQISISKSDLKWRKERAKLEKAIEHSDLFESKYIPQIQTFHEKCTQLNVFLFDYKEIKNFEETGILPEISIIRNAEKTWRHSLRLLDTISASFITDLASEKVGYSIIGPTFCLEVFKVHDLIVWARKVEGQRNFMDMTIKLYELWSPRYHKECFTEEELANLNKYDGQGKPT